MTFNTKHKENVTGICILYEHALETRYDNRINLVLLQVSSLKILSIGIYFADHSIYIVCVDCNGFLIYLLFVLKLKE
jgi:hypothetical membrane protein